jgi:hypothetical protein
MQSAERYIQQWEAELSDVYQDYRAGHITKNMYLAEKEKLDRQLKAAQEVYNEYKEKFEERVLSEKDIRVATRECKNLADYLDRVGEITFEQQRRIIELLNITGKHTIKWRGVGWALRAEASVFLSRRLIFKQVTLSCASRQ